MNVEFLRELSRHQRWADAEHWKALRANAVAFEDPEIQKRLKHMLQAYERLTALGRGESPVVMKERESMDELEAAMQKASEGMDSALASVDLEKMIALPRGPRGPFEAPAGVLLMQALLHNQHHRGQNASRMRQLGVTPPMTDFVLWYAIGRP